MGKGEIDAKGAAEAGLFKLFEALQVIPGAENVEVTVRELLGRRDDGDPDELARAAVSRATWLLTGTGVVASLPGAVPGLGTATQAAITSSSVTAETWLLLRNLTVMQLVVAGIYGCELTDPGDPSKVHPGRLDELLIIWGLETGVVLPAAEAGKRVGTKVAVSQFNKKVSGEVLAKINQKIGTTVLTKWGTKRGGIALGRLIPFGVGSAVGGGMNYVAARSFGAAVIKYYSGLGGGGDGAGEVVVVE